MVASDSGRLILQEPVTLSRVRKMRVCGIGYFFGGTTCAYRPPPVTKVHNPYGFSPKALNEGLREKIIPKGSNLSQARRYFHQAPHTRLYETVASKGGF